MGILWDWRTFLKEGAPAASVHVQEKKKLHVVFVVEMLSLHMCAFKRIKLYTQKMYIFM